MVGARTAAPRHVATAADDFWTSLLEQVADMELACNRRGRDASFLRRSLLLGFGTVQPTTSVEANADQFADPSRTSPIRVAGGRAGVNGSM
jgi:hypothetical protein